ncbi:MAG: COR domain-containing protein, partial [Pirellulaceae bacterium]
LSAFKQFLEAGMKINSEEGGASCESRIDVHGCPLINPPVEIVQQGSEAILGYFNEIELQGIDRLYEAKVLILGEGGAGKTSLLRRLYRTDLGLPNERESTKGIDIYHHEFSHTEGRPFRLNVWDFGGQQIYHSTHQFFLTKRSLYILVDDTRNDSTTIHDQGFKYWLEVVEALSSSCPVLIFQNEKAGRSKTIDESGIKGRFPNVKEIYRGNLFQADAAKCLEEAIRFHVQTLPHVGDEVPAQWARIRSHLENLKKESPCISFGAYLAVYEQYLPKDKSKALMLSQYFHDLGVFLHFQDDMVLTRTVILQNEWATEAVFKVLDDESTKAKNGYFTMIDCQRIWAESTYADMHLELLALMEKFELCY